MLLQRNFEKDVTDELLFWAVSNEHFRRYTGQHNRVFVCSSVNIIEINLNCMRHEYLTKFVANDHNLFFTRLLKQIEPIIFKVMASYRITEHHFTYHFYFLTRTYTREIDYSFVAKTK